MFGHKRKHKNQDKKPSLNTGEYEQVGQWMQEIVETGFVHKGKMVRASFIKGLVSGAGGVIGATVTIFLLLWILSPFHNVPLVGRFADKFRSSINTTQHLK